MSQASIDRELRWAERTASVVEWRSEGVPFAEIGRRLEVSAQRAHQIWEKALADLPAPKLAEHRASQLTLIDAAIRDLLKIARDEQVSPRTRVESWTALRGWAERQAKLLGTDSPTRKEITVISQDVVDAEIQKLTAELELSDAQAAQNESAGT